MNAKKSTSELKFDSIKERYLSAYEKYNGKKVFDLCYIIGWVCLRTCKYSSASKYRISEFEKMTLTLESRIKEGEKEVKYNNGWNKISEIGLPEPEQTVVWLRDEGEPPVIASMLDSDFYGIDYFTHWRPNDFLPPLR
jgi:hypothetical protein